MWVVMLKSNSHELKPYIVVQPINAMPGQKHQRTWSTIDVKFCCRSLRGLLTIPFIRCAISAIIFCGTIRSQNDTFYFKHFNVDNGLSHRNVSSIIQDSLGFMWYGTAEGLSMFDGYNFLPFKHDPKDPNSLISDEITCLATEKKGVIWIGTKNKGVNCYSSYSGKYDLFQHDVNLNSLSDDRITSIFCDSIHGLVWIGTGNGLNSFDPGTKKFRNYLRVPDADHSISSNKITCIRMDKQGRLWIGTNGGGINVLNYATGKFQYLA